MEPRLLHRLHSHGTLSKPLFFQCAFSCAFGCLLSFLMRSMPVRAQGSVEELRNSYNFLEAGLSTLAAGASVALCLARGRLDSEMQVVDFFTMTRFSVQNKYNSRISMTGNNGSIIGVALGAGGADCHPNAVMWIAHNTWAQGNASTLVKFCVGAPAASGSGAPTSGPTPSHVVLSVTSPSSPTQNALISASPGTPTYGPTPSLSHTSPSSSTAHSTPAPTSTSTSVPASSMPPAPAPMHAPTVTPSSTSTSTSTSMALHSSTSTATSTSTPTSPPAAASGLHSLSCSCWHIPSISANASGRGGLASLQTVECLVPPDPQCYRVPSYQCHIHGQAHMPTLHQTVQRGLAQGWPLAMALEGPSQLVQYMLDDERARVPYVYFFGVDNLGARTLKRMVSESMATQDASQKGRTSDLVDWSLGKLELSDKPNVIWHGSTSTVILVSLLEVLLMIVLSVVFGLDPFVSSLGARRGTRSLRLGEGGVTVFADLWLLEVRGYTIRGWENTPVLRVKPRKSLMLWYFDAAVKLTGLMAIFAFWITCVFGYAHPLGLRRSEAWRTKESWAIYVGTIGTVIGFFTSSPMTGMLDRFAPTMSKGPGFYMLRLCWLECMLELGLAVLRILHAKNRLGVMHINSHDRYWWLLPCWYVTLEAGVWLQWLTSKRSMKAGPHSESKGVAWALTILQAGAFARATILAAVSGSWQDTST